MAMAILTLESTEIDTCETTTLVLTEAEADLLFGYLIDTFGRNRILYRSSPEDPTDDDNSCEVCGVSWPEHERITEGSRCDV